MTTRPYIDFQKFVIADGLIIKFFFNTITDFIPDTFIFF